jgi:hypothetical protein
LEVLAEDQGLNQVEAVEVAVMVVLQGLEELGLL